MLKAGAATMALAGVPFGRTAQAAVSGEDARLSALFESMMDQTLDRSPETVTTLGLDSGSRIGAKGLLDDRSLLAWDMDKARNAASLRALNAIHREALTGLNRSNYDSVRFGVELQDEINRALPFAGGPYVLSQLTGAYQSVPDFLDSQHVIANSADAEGYLARLDAFATAIDQESEQCRHDVALGVVPPDFVLTKALIQMRQLRDASPAKSNLVQSIARRTHAAAIPGDWEARAGAIYAARVQPALDRQAALLDTLLPQAVHTAGVARLPHGEAIYALNLRNFTTSTVPPTEIHTIGMDMIRDQTAQIDSILKKQGLTKGTVGQRLRALYDDPRQRYANTDLGKKALIDDLNRMVEKITVMLPQWFGTLPKARLDIRRVPVATEAGAPGGYYQSGSLDGARPGAYYINLRDTAETPRFVLPTLTFHEGIPGHHLQGSLAQETDLPTIRKIQFFSGYGEGWALYAEQLAVEMGMYHDDPLGLVGQLHDAMFRAVRLVVDSGMHAQGWSREQAVTFYTDTLGDPESAAITEVERYCVWPGQACSYMLGKIAWVELRARAKAQLGPRFDIRTFHDAGLLAGAMPLPVLASRIDDHIAASRGA
jgi:uncharacterized protein (DUF885 family)